ncbi:MAG: ABC transporter permease [Ferruginibacter sp.]|nr:ABC transporter permease [Cytophagales bacterium]
MLRNYLLITFRNLLRYRIFSSINILGLALGIAGSLLIGLWVRDEVGVDAFHANGRQLYQVMEQQFYDGGKQQVLIYTPGLLYQELKRFPEITHASVFTWWDNPLAFRVGSKVGKESGRYASGDFFRMFSYPLLAGKAETALQSATGVAISQRMASRYFGSPQVALGQTLRVENRQDYRVTAVFRDVPDNSSYQFDFVLPWPVFVAQNAWTKDWNNSGPVTFIQIRPDADGARLEAKLRFLLKSYRKDPGTQLFLQPYREGYLYSVFKNGRQRGGRIEYVRLFSAVAVFILLIACINFTNLSTAQSFKRSREVGVRKVMGTVRSHLIGQFLGEALLLTLLAVMLALAITAWMLPVFNQLTGKHIRIPLSQPSFLFSLGVLTLLVGLVAGSYPALYLSSLKPVRVLKTAPRLRSQARLFRQGLVVLQFTLSVLLIFGTIVVYQQVSYLRSKQLGYERENLLYVPIEGALKYPRFKRALVKLPGILAVTRMTQLPIHIGGLTWELHWEGKPPNARISFVQNSVGYDFTRTLGLKLRQGRDFSPAFPGDTSAYLINETAAKAMGMAHPVGQSVIFRGRPGKIVGLLPDFHFQSLRTPIEPLLIWLQEENAPGSVMVRTQPGKTREAIGRISSLARKMNPHVPFTHHFVEEEYQQLYGGEQVIGKLANYFAFLGIFISCLGLLGLVTFSAEQRTKEIGVRKMLGANTITIVVMLSKDFLKLVLLANGLALPLAWWAMNHWLEDFAYRTAIHWWIFALAGGTSLLIALLTIGWQVIEAAVSNPIKSLRTE